jgi:antitoxin component HigA of HigAB toxin-antitoxin module
MNRNIRAEMVRHGLTAKYVAKELGISAVSVSHKLNGKRQWTLPEAKKIVDYFNSLGGNHTIESLFFNIPTKVIAP